MDEAARWRWGAIYSALAIAIAVSVGVSRQGLEAATARASESHLAVDPCRTPLPRQYYASDEAHRQAQEEIWRENRCPQARSADAGVRPPLGAPPPTRP